jgi:VWFA-related protein
MRRSRATLAAAVFCVVLPRAELAVVAAQEKPPTFPSAVELVTVDVVVTDKQGRPVTGLESGDFTLLEDGAAQAIASFDAVAGFSATDLPEAAEAAAIPWNPRVSTNLGAPVRAGRTYVIVFDEVHLSSLQAARGKRALETFLKSTVLDGERVRLVAVGGFEAEGTRDELLDEVPRLTGRRVPDESFEALSDHEAMRIAVFDDQPLILRVIERISVLTSGRHTGDREGERIRILTPDELDTKMVDEGYVKLLARRVYHDATSRNQATLAALESAIEAVAGIRGRKSVVLVSEALIKDPQLDGFGRVIDASRRANAALYFIDTRGLETIPGESAQHATYLPSIDQGIVMANQQLDAAGAESLAADSGGFTVKNRNDLSNGFRQIATDTRNYYLLGYSPPRGQPDGRFRKIQVKVKRSGVEVRARKGYYGRQGAGSKAAVAAPDSATGPAAGADRGDASQDIVAALRSGEDRTGIPLRMSAYVLAESSPGKVRALVATEVDVRGVVFEERDGHFQGALDFLVVVAAGGGEPSRSGHEIELNLTPEKREALATRWLPVVRAFDLAPGDYRARVVVRDGRSGRIGSVTHAFEVPSATFRTSTPVLSDSLEAGEAGKRPPAVGARRTFREQATLYFDFEVYGAARDPANGAPRVASGWTVLDPAGTEWARSEPSWMGGLQRGVPARQSEVSLTFPAGAYELVLDVHDHVSGRTLEVHEPFEVEAAP